MSRDMEPTPIRRPPEPILVAWGRNIVAAREALGIEQKDLADLLNPPVTQATVSRWEGGLVEPRIASRLELCRVLAVSGEELFPLEPIRERAS